jgi:phospholipase/carboxylesterase
VLLSLGRHDMLLPFAAAETLRERLTTAGAQVEWHAFLGGHEIPSVVLGALRGFLAARLATSPGQ